MIIGERDSRRAAGHAQINGQEAGGTKNQCIPLPTKFDLKKLIEECIGEKRESASTNNVKLTANCSLRLRNYFARRAPIRRLILNLLDDAIHHSPKGGTVYVIGKLVAGEIIVKVVDQGAEPWPRVTNNGCDSAACQKSDKQKYNHPTSISSYVSEQIVQGHGGHMGAAISARKWTTVSVVLPMVRSKRRG